MKQTIRIVSLALIVIAVAPVAFAHRYHTSVTRLEYKSEDRVVEITVQTFADDVEAALSKRSGVRNVQLDVDSKTNALLLQYLSSTIVLKNGDDKLEVEWIGMELKGHSVWFYLQAKAPEGLPKATLSNNLLFDLFTDQINIVNVFNNGKKSSLTFKRGDAPKAVP
ncbi:MAG TPA: DUF6702 family protein [Pyrinomonadaceae bacterium]|nr:DUF6702 family protein [Pyrinomonadaceae bacterium]